MTPAHDRHARPLGSLRISVTDRCNLRCRYCMPEESYEWLPRTDILRFEEIARLVDAFLACGVRRVRLTGGEPLLRRDLPRLVEMLAGKAELEDLALTTNGLALPEQAGPLRAAGLHRITVSLDTLRRERFVRLTRRDGLDRVRAGIEAVRRAGFPSLKIDSVLMRGVNDDEIADLIELGREVGAEVRFIEYMDVAGATRWSASQVFTRAEILESLERRYGTPQALGQRGPAPAERFQLSDGTVFGLIASTTAPFCARCDRSRLTADGFWYLCLYARCGIDLRGALRAGAGDEELRRRIRSIWEARADRGAEQRREMAQRFPPEREVLQRDPHLEMHTRGG